jgi:anti-sigma B factor antagonist
VIDEATVGPPRRWDGALGIDFQLERPSSDTAVLTVCGEIDMLTAPALLQAGRAALEQAQRLLILDLAAVSFIGASGLATLLRLRDAVACRGAELRLARSSDVVLRCLSALRLTALFNLHDGPPEPATNAPPKLELIR